LWIVLFVTTVSTVLIYLPVANFQFNNWDDPEYITENPHVREGLSWANVWWALTTTHTPYWHPVTWLSHMTDVSLFGMHGGGHHVASLLFHIANSVLLFVLLKRSTSRVWSSAVCAMLFAVHPLHVESVAWVAERKDVLCAFLSLLALVSYVRYTRTGRSRSYVWTLTSFALALAAKPMAVTLPLWLLVLDAWPLRRVSDPMSIRSWWPVLREKVPLLCLSVAGGLATIAVQRDVGAMASIAELGLADRLANVVVSYVLYLKLTFWPAGLVPFYPPERWSPATVAFGAALLVLVTTLLWRWRQRAPYLLAGWAWFVIGIAPVSGLLQAGEQAVADRFMYLPIVGLLLAVVWGTSDLLGRVPRRALVAGALSALTVLVLALMSRVQLQAWENSVMLWQHSLRVDERNYRAHEKLAEAYRDLGRWDLAVRHYELALETAPPGANRYRAIVRNALGYTHTRSGDQATALRHLGEAVQLDPALAVARLNFGNALAATGDLPRAEVELQEALRLDGSLAEALIGLGAIAIRRGNPGAAKERYTAALGIDPHLPAAHNGIGAALLVLEQPAQALPHLAEALRLDPAAANAHLNMGLALIRLGRLDEARVQLQSALEIDPSLVSARAALARLQ
jgi:tetratricopeptide (TPR) repeat protein